MHFIPYNVTPVCKYSIKYGVIMHNIYIYTHFRTQNIIMTLCIIYIMHFIPYNVTPVYISAV